MALQKINVATAFSKSWQFEFLSKGRVYNPLGMRGAHRAGWLPAPWGRDTELNQHSSEERGSKGEGTPQGRPHQCLQHEDAVHTSREGRRGQEHPGTPRQYL